MASTNFEDLIIRDTRGNQPAAGIPGRIMYVTDEEVTERDNGSTWDDISDSGGGGATGYYGVQLLNTAAGAGGAASFVATSIASTYDVIKLWIQGRGEVAATSDTVTIAYNSDTTDGNYYREYHYGVDASSIANEAATRIIGSIGGASNVYNVGQIEMTIINPAGIFQKSGLSSSTWHTATAQTYVMHTGIQWLSTAAIYSITLACSGGDFAEGTKCVIVGLKNNV